MMNNQLMRMNSLQKIGSVLLGGAVALMFFGRQKLSFGIKRVALSGVITTQLIPLKVIVYIANKTIASLLVRSLSGVVVCNGETLATVAQPINRRISANSYIEQNINIDLHITETLRALIANIQTGDINNLSFELIGEVVVGEQWPIGIKFNRVFTWAEIQQML